MNYAECLRTGKKEKWEIIARLVRNATEEPAKIRMPGPGAKGIGDTAIRNYDKWKEIRVRMDTLVEKRPIDTSLSLFGKNFQYPFFAGPVGSREYALRAIH